jgi:hypothetical protein
MKREDLREIIDFIQATGIVVQKLRNVCYELDVGFMQDEEFEFFEENEDTKESLGKKCLNAKIEINDIIKYLTHNQQNFGRN